MRVTRKIIDTLVRRLIIVLAVKAACRDRAVAIKNRCTFGAENVNCSYQRTRGAVARGRKNYRSGVGFIALSRGIVIIIFWCCRES